MSSSEEVEEARSETSARQRKAGLNKVRLLRERKQNIAGYREAAWKIAGIPRYASE